MKLFRDNLTAKISLIFLLPFFLVACDNSDDENAVTPITDPDAAFTEGIITTEVTMPGNPLAAIISQIDPSQGNIEEQLAELISQLSPEEQEALNESMEGSGMFAIAALMTPFETELYVRPDEILARGYALNYYLENYQSTSKDEGLFYLESLSSDENHMLGTYTPSLSEAIWQTITVTHEDYDIERLKDTEVVAGYACGVASYTLKNPTGAEVVGHPLRLMVYTSEAMPKELNFQHPFYIPENSGILRIDVTYDAEGKNKMIYQAVDIESKPLNDTHFVTKTSPNVYDLDSDDGAAGIAMLAIMFGGE